MRTAEGIATAGAIGYGINPLGLATRGLVFLGDARKSTNKGFIRRWIPVDELIEEQEQITRKKYKIVDLDIQYPEFKTTSTYNEFSVNQIKPELREIARLARLDEIAKTRKEVMDYVKDMKNMEEELIIFLELI